MRVATLHASDWKGVFYITGGGIQLLTQLTSTPGASHTVLDARIPYSRQALDSMLVGQFEQAASEQTARALACRAYVDGANFGNHQPRFGLGITAALDTNRPRRGTVRAYVALHTRNRTQVTTVLFDGINGRTKQEVYLTEVAWAKLVWGLGLASDAYPDLDSRYQIATPELEKLLQSDRGHALGVESNTFLPGSFNPLHDGHRKMRAIGEATLGELVQYELCVRAVDKLPLDFLALEERRTQFTAAEFVLSNLATFREKIQHYRKSKPITFLVGVDTVIRIADPAYYQSHANQSSSTVSRDRFFLELIESGTKFLVFGRTMKGRFQTLEDLNLPPQLRQVCLGVSEAEFRMDVASSAIRQG